MDVEVYKQYCAEFDSLIDHEMMILVYCLGQLDDGTGSFFNEGGAVLYARLKQSGYQPTKEEVSWGKRQLEKTVFPRFWGADYKAQMLRKARELHAKST